MAVLLKQEAGMQTSGQVQSLLAQGKMTMNATPGGRMFQKIAPILRDYGGVDMRPSVPLIYTPTPVPPIIAPECNEDPTQGFTEYPGTFSAMMLPPRS